MSGEAILKRQSVGFLAGIKQGVCHVQMGVVLEPVSKLVSADEAMQKITKKRMSTCRKSTPSMLKIHGPSEKLLPSSLVGMEAGI